MTPVVAWCTSAPCCADVWLQPKRLCYLRAREHRWLQEARSSYSSGSGGSHSSNGDRVKEDVFRLTVCVHYSLQRVGMRSTVQCHLNTSLQIISRKKVVKTIVVNVLSLLHA